MSVNISIITITYNNIDGFRKTLASIIESHIEEHIEWIVADGGSNDGTEECICEYSGILADRGIRLIYENEKDQGRYDGMNKGIDRAQGRWCIFLNAGDRFCFNETLSLLSGTANRIGESAEIIYGDTILELHGRFKYANAPDEQKLDFSGPNPICHQSCLIRTDLMRRHKYDLEYKYAADFDFLVKAYGEGVRFQHISEPIALYDKTGLSSKNSFAVRQEFAEISYRYGHIAQDEYKRRISGGIGIKRLLRRIIPESLMISIANIRNEKSADSWYDDINSAYLDREIH